MDTAGNGGRACEGEGQRDRPAGGKQIAKDEAETAKAHTEQDAETGGP